MIKAFVCSIVVFLVIILILICVGYWLFNVATLDKLGYADTPLGEIEQPNGSVVEVTPRGLGIEDMTLKELLNWFKSKTQDNN